MSLERRRNQASVLFLCMLLQGRIDCLALLSKIDNILVPRLATRQGNIFYCQRAQINLLLKSSVNVMCAYTNIIALSAPIY